MASTKEASARGRRLFSALKNFQRYVMVVRPASELRPSEFAMLHSVLCCLARQVQKPSEPPSDVSITELARRSDSPGVTIGELSAFTHQTPSGASQTVRALEEKGLVIRSTLPADRRAVYVRPTEQGWDTAETVEKPFFARLDEIARELGEEDAEQLILLLDRLTEIIRARNSHTERMHEA